MRKGYLILTLFYSVIIFLISSLPGPMEPIKKPGLDFFAHVVEYSILGFLALGCFEKNKSSILLFVIFICSLYGVLDEVHQYFVPGRYFSGLDMFANSLGSMLGVMMNLKFYKRVSRKI